MLSALLDGNNVHESGGVAWLGSDLVVDLDETLSGDGQDFSSSQGVLESVSQQDDQGERLADLVGTRGWSRSICSRELVQHP